jgi:hypothetical protein
MRKTILSSRLVHSRAELLGKSLLSISQAAGLPTKSGYIYRLLGRDNVHLSTVNRIALALRCRVCDILEEIEVDDDETEEARAVPIYPPASLNRLQTQMSDIGTSQVPPDKAQAEAERRAAYSPKRQGALGASERP